MEVSESNGRELYDLEAVYDEQISPLMKQIIEICRDKGMPMVASFAIANHDEKGTYNCTTVLPGSEGRQPKRHVKMQQYANHGADGPPMWGTIMIGSEKS